MAKHEGVFDGRYKLIHFYEHDEWELFDLKLDPLEMHSVFGDPDYAGRTVQLQRRLKELKVKYKAPAVA